MAVFGYGSLASRASAGGTLDRDVEIAALARLHGYARGWTVARKNVAVEKTFARLDGSHPRFCLGLNVHPAAGANAPNGVLVEVSAAELARLDLREVRFERVDVTDSIEVSSEAVDGRPVRFDRVYAYRARPEHYFPQPPDDAIVIAAYPRLVESAFADLGPDQLAMYRATTPPPPVEVAEARLVTDTILAGNPRAW